jgi:putative N-acetyltransferase (TIGR04045 family)
MSATALLDLPTSQDLRVRVVRADSDPVALAAYAALRRRAFVDEQQLFARDDADDHDGAPATQVLVALGDTGAVIGGVRLHPAGDDPSLGWWRGSRLVCSGAGRPSRGLVGALLVRAACARAIDAGALRFDAHVQLRHARFFARLGWVDVRTAERVAGAEHRLMRWPVDRIQALAEATKLPLGALLAGALGTPPAWLGDDGVPVPGSDLVAATDGILPAMVAADPEWAGWCGMLVSAHDLAAMGATPVGALDALAAPDAAHAARVLDGLRRGAQIFGLPLLGGHTQLGVAAALSVTGLGHAPRPVPAGGGRPGDVLSVTADLAGGWRTPYGHRQWDSSTHRTREELRTMLDAVRVARPRAAKDVSMAGVVGTVGMLAEASGCGAVLDVAAIPRPAGTDAADWLTCFPGFAMVTADAPDAPPLPAGPATGAVCGRLQSAPGVRLRWPDGVQTTVVAGPVTGLGPCRQETP